MSDRFELVVTSNGNITQKDSTTYTYNASHKHAVASLSADETYTYDANRNMTQRVEGGLTYTQTLDAENRLISVTVSGQTMQFIYEGDGNLVKKIKPDGSKTLYPSTTPHKHRLLLRHALSGSQHGGSGRHLGSASVVTAASGNILGEQRYYPFGKSASRQFLQTRCVILQALDKNTDGMIRLRSAA